MQLFSTIKEKRLPLIIESAQRMMEGKQGQRYHPIPAEISLEVDNIKEDTGISSPDSVYELTKEEKIYCGII